MTIETIQWHTLHPRYLDTRSNVLDLGANHGHFARAISNRFGCTCVAVEPSPAPFAAIPQSSQIKKLQLAVAEKSGVMPFHVARQSTASSLLGQASSHQDTISVGVRSLPELFQELAWSHVDLLKVDIEGSEIAMLAACPDELLKRIAQISIEFHDFCAITPRADVEATLARLHRLGFFSVRMSRVGHQDTWLVNQRLIDISKLELLFIKYAVRNWFGIKRLVARVAKAAFARGRL
jgi:FkbM family methyltransferase